MDSTMQQQASNAIQTINRDLSTSIDFGKIKEFVAYLHKSEKLLINAIERAQNKPLTFEPPPTSGGAEFGWLPYLLSHAAETHPTDPLISYFQEILKEVFGKHTAAAEVVVEVLGLLLEPELTDAQWHYLETNMGNSNIIANDGTIVGDSKYEDLDKDWLYTPAWYLYNLAFPREVASFTPLGSVKPFNDTIGNGASSIKIAIIGDWGTGDYSAAPNYRPAAGVMQAIKNLNPDYVIHLGDVYYCGTEDRVPSGEESENLVQQWPGRFYGKSFTLNSNHEMYGGAQGYFEVALNRKDVSNSPFSLQNGFSYFALDFKPWVLVGMDAAYHDTSSLYMQGGIGTAPGDPQLEFLQQIATQYQDRQVILLSHQTGMSTDGTTVEGYPLLKQVEATGLKPDYWYWGHIHLGIVYGEKSAVAVSSANQTKSRCVGHSAIPFGNPWGLGASGNVIDFIADTPVDGSSLAKNGLAMLTLGNDGSITEQFFDGVTPGSTEAPAATWTITTGRRLADSDRSRPSGLLTSLWRRIARWFGAD